MDKREHWAQTQLTYDGELLSYSKYTNAVIRRGHRLIVELSEQVARNQNTALTILDVGCGWTDLYGKLKHVVGTYIGIEPSAAQILRAPRKPNMYLVRGVGERIVLGDECVDLALLVAVLDHCLDAEKTIREVFRVLRPGGTALILLENRGRISNYIRALLKMEISHGEEHLYYFDVDDICGLVKPYGRIEFLRSYGFLVGFDIVSRVLPATAVSGLAAFADALLGSMMRKKGQHFVLAVVKNGAQRSAAPVRFVCAGCAMPFPWGAAICPCCRRSLRWIASGILDTLEPAANPA